jgi:hypothetical protein
MARILTKEDELKALREKKISVEDYRKARVKKQPKKKTPEEMQVEVLKGLQATIEKGISNQVDPHKVMADVMTILTKFLNQHTVMIDNAMNRLGDKIAESQVSPPVKIISHVTKRNSKGEIKSVEHEVVR